MIVCTAIPPAATTVATPSGSESGRNGRDVHKGLEDFTLGHLMPRSEQSEPNGNWSFDPSLGMPPLLVDGIGNDVQPIPTQLMNPPSFRNPALSEPSTSISTSPSHDDTSQKLRVRRSTFVPAWAVPLRVLLVDEDAVNQQLSSKFLQVFGCTTDIPVDGQVAVGKMDLERYDLVLMDIVMPKLDGVTATSLIQQFDSMTGCTTLACYADVILVLVLGLGAVSVSVNKWRWEEYCSWDASGMLILCTGQKATNYVYTPLHTHLKF